MDDFKAMIQIFQDEAAFSDLTITCNGKEYYSHRVIAASHSKWFGLCFTGWFLGHTSSRVDLQGDKQDAVERMINFFYKFDYEEALPEKGTHARPYGATDRLGPGQELELHAWVLVVADKYDVPGLTKCALPKFKLNLKKKLNNAKAILAAAAIIYGNITARSDRIAHNALVDAWIMYNRISPKDTDHREFIQALEKQPAFAVDIQTRLFDVIQRAEHAECEEGASKTDRSPGRLNRFDCTLWGETSLVTKK